MSVLQLENLAYRYDHTNQNVFEELNFTFEPGKIYSIVGKSGAGKTTLLSLLAGLTSPTGGKILLNGEDTARMNKYELRSKRIGVVFQSFNLLTHLTAVENVLLSMDISGKKFEEKKKQAYSILGKVDLDEEEANRRVLKLSGGQQQRVAIARALSYDPLVILADEPTGNLDGETQDEIMSIFRRLANEGKCIIIVTHSPSVADASDVIYELKKAVKQPKNTKKTKASL